MKKKALSLALALALCLGLFPMSALAATPSTGSFGENIAWALEDSGTLFVRGTGDMDNYTANTAPWNKNRTAVKEIIIESGVTSIGDYTFMSCDALSTVRIPYSVTRIGNCAFGFSGLTSVTIPNGVTEIERQTFNSCTKLSTVNIPEGVKIIGSGAFYNCTSLTEIVLPDSITNIKQNAFRACNNLSSISIGNQVVEIDRHVFADCDNLKDVYYGGTEAQWKAIQIGDDNAPLINANIHYNSEPPAPGLHGRISLSFGDKQSSSGVAYVPGDAVITIHAAPDPGYQLSVIRVVRNDNGQQVPLSGSGNTRTFRMPPADVSIQAEFSVR